VGESRFRVTIDEGSSRTVHEVIASASDLQRYGPATPAEDVIRASFEFLLEREPKESILSRFELSVIQRFFPDYPAAIRERLGSSR